MADDNFDIARDFAEAIGSDVEMVNESVPDTNSGDMTQNSNIIDLTESENPLEKIQETQNEEPEETQSSLTDGEEQQESPQSEPIQDDSNIKELDDDDALFVLNEKYGTNYDNMDELLDDLDSQE